MAINVEWDSGKPTIALETAAGGHIRISFVRGRAVASVKNEDGTGGFFGTPQQPG